MTQALTEQQIALLATAGTLDVVAKTDAEIAAEAATAQAATQAAEAERARVAAETQAAADAVDPAKLQATIATLTLDAKKADDARIALAVDLKIANDKVAALEASVAPLRAVVETSLKTMQVAMKQTVVPCTGDTNALLTAHAAASAAFTAGFKVGGVAAVTPETKTDAAAASVQMSKQRIAAVGL